MKFDIIFKLDKSIYSKNALIATVYDYVDDCAILLETTEDKFIVKVKADDGFDFDKSKFIKDLNVNEMREIVEQRTGNMRDALYMATVVKGI